MEEARRQCPKENAGAPVSFGRVWRQTDGRVLMKEARRHCLKENAGTPVSFGSVWRQTDGRVLMKEARRHCLKENAGTPVSFGSVWRQTDGRVLMKEARRQCPKENAGTPVSFGRVWRQRDCRKSGHGKSPAALWKEKTRYFRWPRQRCDGNATAGKAVMEKARQLCGKKKHGISGGLGKDVTAMRLPEKRSWKKPGSFVERKNTVFPVASAKM